MMIHDITAKVEKYKNRKRIGRGQGSGTGGTSGRGHKGAKSRSGWTYRPHFEGGQKAFFRRLPKRGFSNVQFATTYHVVNLKALEAAFDDGATVDAPALAKAGLASDPAVPIKVLGEGDLTKKLHVTASKFSASARAKIEKAGGSVTEIPKRKWSRPEGE